jgi:hypothetical protein
MKASSTSRAEHSRPHGPRQRHGPRMGQAAMAVPDHRLEREQQQDLISLMAASPRLQRQCSCGSPAATGGSCAACERKAVGLGPLAIQGKLAIGATDDPLEHEADRLAEQVMRAPEPPRQHPCDVGGSCSGARSGAQAEAPQILQTKPVGAGHPALTAAPPSVLDVIRSPGRPLDPLTRAFMEPRFGHDFSDVRVHTGADASQSALEIGARAYTAGSSIVFAEGQASTSTYEGRRLLAHELAHVVQQGKAKRAPTVVRRAPWGTCPAGPRRAANNPFVYQPAELYALGQYKLHNPTHCVLTNEMLAAGIVPSCGGTEKATLKAIFAHFHHEHEVSRRTVASPKDVTRRPEAKSGALIQSGIEKVKALQQPDIVDITAQEVYDITTTGQAGAKRNKFSSRYIPLLRAITNQSWSAGTRLKAFVPLTYKIPKIGTICYGPTDFSRWPGVIQYEAIKPEEEKTKEKKKKKSEKDDKKKDKQDKKEDKKKGGAPGGNVGFGIGLFSSGGGKGNAVLGVAINAHGNAYGTASAGIVYDANGNAVGAAAVSAGAHVSGNVAGAANVGAGHHASTDAAAVAGAGTSAHTDTIAVAGASSGSARNTSTVTIATVGQGDAKDLDQTAMAQSGGPQGDSPGGGQKAGQPGGPAYDGPAGQGTTPQTAVQGGASGPLQIPGKSNAESAKIVADAARIDAELQKATPAQKDLLVYLAQQSDNLQYEVADAQWVFTFMEATKGLSEADIRFLQQQQWRPTEHITPEDLRKQIDERLRNRNRPMADAGKGTKPANKPDTPEKKDRTNQENQGTAAEVKKPEDATKAASLDASTDSRHAETDQEAFKRLLERAKKYDWAHMRAAGVLIYGKDGKVYAPATVTGQLYISTVIRGKPTRVTADIAGILKKGKNEDILEIRSCSIVVAVDGRVGPGSMLTGLKIDLSP